MTGYSLAKYKFQNWLKNRAPNKSISLRGTKRVFRVPTIITKKKKKKKKKRKRRKEKALNPVFPIKG